jgi:hypothetical protein
VKFKSCGRLVALLAVVLAVVLSAVLSVSPALAQSDPGQRLPPTPPTPYEGTFAFEGQYQISGHRHSEIVVAISDAERAKLERLKSEGYTCMAKPAQQFLCSIEVAVDPFNAVVAKRVQELFAGYQVQFYAAVGAPSLEINAELFRQWRISQKIVITTPSREVTTRFFDFANYAWASGLDKIYPGGTENVEHDMLTPTTGGLEVPLVIHSQPSRFQMDSYFVTVRLPKLNL